MDDDLREGRRHAGDEVEDEEAPVPESVFDVVAEDPQVEHVAGDVEQAAVHEHRGEDRRERRRKIPGDRAGAGHPARNRAELEDERFRRPLAVHADRGRYSERRP